MILSIESTLTGAGGGDKRELKGGGFRPVSVITALRSGGEKGRNRFYQKLKGDADD